MKEYAVKVVINKEDAKRQLFCDVCGVVLNHQEEENVFYANIYVSDKGVKYIEKYICEKCKDKIYYDLEVVELNEADKDIQRAIKKDMKKDYYYVYSW